MIPVATNTGVTSEEASALLDSRKRSKPRIVLKLTKNSDGQTWKTGFVNGDEGNTLSEDEETNTDRMETVTNDIQESESMVADNLLVSAWNIDHDRDISPNSPETYIKEFDKINDPVMVSEVNGSYDESLDNEPLSTRLCRLKRREKIKET